MEASDSDTSEALKEGANGGEDDVEEREDEEMEKELEKLEEKLNNLRRTLPERFVAALSSSMLVQRSVLPLESLGFGWKNDGELCFLWFFFSFSEFILSSDLVCTLVF